MEKRGKYRPIAGEDGDELSEQGSVEQLIRPKDWRVRILVISNICLLAVVGILSVAIARPDWISRPLNADLKRVSFYTPVLDRLEIPVETVQHDNTLFAHSEYVQSPSPEVEQLWNDLSYPRLFLVDDDTIRRVGKDPEYTVQHPTKPGQHITYLALTHQLHCLNDIRQNLFADYYYPDGVPTSGQHMDHLKHCIDLMRETLMCNANLDLITFNWWELTPNPQPDFHVNMKCRNWDVIQDYLSRPFEETGVFRWDEEGWTDGWQRQGGEKNVTIGREWWRIALDGGVVTPTEFQDRWGEIKADDTL